MKDISMLENCTSEEELCVERDSKPQATHFFPKDCPKPCKITQFTGEINERDLDLQGTSLLFIRHTSTTITIEEEYRIYDFFDMVGSIGGSLGLCVGLSIFDLFSIIVNKIFGV